MTKRSGKHPTRKTTKTAPKKGGSSEKRATKDASVKSRIEPPPRTARARDERLPAIGTKIQRTWRKKVYEVECLKDGFRWSGKEYPTLSATARAITGFNAINGFLFFGLTPRTIVCPNESEGGAS